MPYRIGEFAELSGVSAKTLRHYEKLGLLRPAAVDVRTGYRRYGALQLRDLASILALRDLGLSLAEIRAFRARSATRAERLTLLARLRADTQRTLEAARRSLIDVDAVLEEFDSGPDSWASTIPVIVKRLPLMRVASVRMELKAYDELVVQRLEHELHASLPADSIGAERGVLWRRLADSDSLEAEPFIEVRRQIPRRSFYELKDLTAVTAACAFSSPDDDAAEHAYGAIRKWMATRGCNLAGAKREIYRDRMLEIQFPLQSA